MRLTLWGHQFASLTVSSAGQPLTVSGGVRFDPDKKASFVMLRMTVTRAQPRAAPHTPHSGAGGARGQSRAGRELLEDEAWDLAVSRRSIDRSIDREIDRQMDRSRV